MIKTWSLKATFFLFKVLKEFALGFTVGGLFWRRVR